MECTLEELVRKLSALLKDHPNAAIYNDMPNRLVVEDGFKTFLDGAGNKIHGSEEVFFISTDAHKFFDNEDCVTIKECK